MKKSQLNVQNADIPLCLNWCSYEAAKYAVLNWHYSKAMPSGKAVKIGVWEYGKFIGCILFGLGANMNLSKLFGLKNTEVCELTRIALTKHKTPVSRLIRISLKMLKQSNPGLELVVSYADRDQGHEGKIYQASNFIKHGQSFDEHYLMFGKKCHPRSVNAKYGTRSIPRLLKVDPSLTKIKTKGKIRYIYWLKKRAAIVESAYQANQLEGGGVVPTAALQFQESNAEAS